MSNVVLLVDDNPLQLGIRETVLRAAGFAVVVAAAAENALATLRQMGVQIGVLITDHIMPGCSGAELVRQIRTENYWLPVVVLSGMPEAFSEYDGLEVDFRQKPLPPTELIALVHAYLDRGYQSRGAA